LSSPEAAQRAVDALHKKELDGREVIVEIAKPADQKDKEKKEKKAKRRPGRRGSKAVPGEVSEAEANAETDKAEGTAVDDDAPKHKKKKKKAVPKPKRKSEDGDVSTDVPLADGEKKAGRVRKPKVSRPLRPAGEDPVGEPSKTMLFVANLGFNIDDTGLSSLFTDAGINVVSARIVRRRWGQPRKSKGYGFVDVGGEDEQKKAMDALQNKDVGGRNIAVKVAVNTPQDDEDGSVDVPVAT
jgi:RNA recognition motif-containing protein